jgi:hypothetical protein
MAIIILVTSQSPALERTSFINMITYTTLFHNNEVLLNTTYRSLKYYLNVVVII